MYEQENFKREEERLAVAASTDQDPADAGVVEHQQEQAGLKIEHGQSGQNGPNAGLDCEQGQSGPNAGLKIEHGQSGQNGPGAGLDCEQGQNGPGAGLKIEHGQSGQNGPSAGLDCEQGQNGPDDNRHLQDLPSSGGVGGGPDCKACKRNFWTSVLNAVIKISTIVLAAFGIQSFGDPPSPPSGG